EDGQKFNGWQRVAGQDCSIAGSRYTIEIAILYEGYAGLELFIPVVSPGAEGKEYAGVEFCIPHHAGRTGRIRHTISQHGVPMVTYIADGAGHTGAECQVPDVTRWAFIGYAGFKIGIPMIAIKAKLARR